MVSNRPGGILAGSAELMQLFNQASALHQAGRLDEAEALYKRVIEKDRRQFGAYNLLGVLSAQRGDLKAAIRYATQALKINPNSAETHVNLARMQAESQNHAAALNSLQQALAINPHFALAHNNAAALLLSLQRPTEALNHADQAVSLAANYADAWHNRGNILFSLGRFEEALTSYDRALSLVPADAQSAVGRANALHALQRYAQAIPAADHALRLNPNLTYLEGHRLIAKRHICDWTNHDAECAKVVGHVRQGVYAIEPLSFLVIASSAADQLKCAQQNVATHCPPSPTPAWRGEKYRHDRIRVGYLSADFGDHAVANQIAGVFEHHDRSRFETIAFAFGGPSDSAMRRRLRASFDRFTEVGAQSDADVAQLVRRSEIDIAVDLMGFTRGARTGILARRPAPVAAAYLGYAGTMGAPYIDYILADRTVIPEDARPFYAEQVVYLPDCFFPNDKRPPVGAAPTRAETGLPPEGFVFCASNSNKIGPEMFDIWMRLLHEVEGSVLWLLQSPPYAVDNLRKEAHSRGIAADRLIFAPRTTFDAHVARQRLADLFLDTRPYNAHATASDALWAGVPVLTWPGATYASRVAAELITTSAAEYEALALKLSRDPALLTSLKAKLAENRAASALFDTARITRAIEAAFTTMHERHRRGQPPEGFAVPAA